MRFDLRALAISTAALLAGAVVAGPAAAIPSYTPIWTGTSGSGTTGSDAIAAQPGDVLTLDVLLFDAQPSYGWSFSLLGQGVTAVSGQECPPGSSGGSSTNPLTDPLVGICVSDLGGTIQAISLGVTVSGSDIWDYDAGGIAPIAMDALPLFVGRGVFVANGVGRVDLEADCSSDACAAVVVPEATATIVPEPATFALVGFGIGALGAARRRPRR